jgi:hypothetical protein
MSCGLFFFKKDYMYSMLRKYDKRGKESVKGKAGEDIKQPTKWLGLSKRLLGRLKYT